MSKWFKEFRLTEQPRCRLFCFPYACGGASLFRHWPESLPMAVDVLGMQAPGRECRYLEEPVGALTEKVEILRQEIDRYLDVPSVFVGHSSGALIAFELLRSLDHAAKQCVKAIVISAKRAPHLPRIKGRIHDLPFEELLDRLKALNSIPGELLADRELMRLFAPLIRADFSVSETYRFVAGPKEHVKAVLFWGRDDPDVSRESMLQWQRHFSQTVEFHTFAGSHFFIRTHHDLFVERLGSIVKPLLDVAYSDH